MSDRLILPPASQTEAESLARSARLSELAERETTLSSIDQQFEELSKLTRLSDKLEGQWQGVRAERAAIETERQSLRAEQAAVDGAQQDPGSGAGTTGHVGNHSAQWKALVIAPDLCKVGKSVVAFNSFACLDRPINRSPNVLGDGLHLYRVGDLFKGIEADAGRHIVSGTSQGRGYVKILTGKDSVKTNGLPTAWQGSRCLVNCNAQGIGGAPGQIVTETKTVERSMARRMGDESAKVIEEAWSGLKGTAKTLWDALPGTADEAATAAARARIGEGIVGTAEGLGTLMGPSGGLDGIALSLTPEGSALIEQMQANQRQAIGAIADNIGQAWREADARSGTAGAIAMVATTIGTEVVGGKGLGALAKTGARIGHIVKMAKTPLEAATKLDAEIKAARAAGRSAEEIKLLEEAREAQLRQAREAANAKAGKAGDGNEGGDGVHVRARRHRVPCFHPYDKKKFAQMTPDQQKGYLKEMAEQLGRQQSFINGMSAAEFKAAREAFEKFGRNPMAEGAQASFRKDFAKSVKESIAASLRKGGMGSAQAKVEAAARTKDVMGKLAALHEPDMVAGGWLQPDPKSMGRADVNSSIGSSWNQDGRVAGMDAAAGESIRGGRGHEKMNVQLEVCRGKGLK